MIFKSFITCVAALLSASGAQSVELIVNGGFESTTLDSSAEFGTRYPTQQVTGWTTSGYNFVFKSGTADTTGASGEYGNLKLWGPGDGAANGLPAASPTGGNFIGADGAFNTLAINQTVTGLIAGEAATVSFYWAAAQQSGFTGATTEQWQVSLGTETQKTAIVSNVDHGFSGWVKQSFTFTPTSSSAVLSFLAIGTPSGVPPFALLDGVSLTQDAVPEPATWALLVTGFGMVGFAARRRRPATVAA